MATSSWRTNLRTVSGPRAAFPALLIVLLAAAACGGGVAPGVPTDGGAPTGADGTPDCNASTCASGCCDIQGRCQPGDTVTACGTSGQACQDCPASAYESCDAVQHVCLTELEQCGPSNCVGCCVQNVCYPGIDSPACGSGRKHALRARPPASRARDSNASPPVARARARGAVRATSVSLARLRPRAGHWEARAPTVLWWAPPALRPRPQRAGFALPQPRTVGRIPARQGAAERTASVWTGHPSTVAAGAALRAGPVHWVTRASIRRARRLRAP